ncbi:hypothetical protein HIM_08994 [Hirsutella minnesotensis 3608]|uniref:BTB domain-containing protein n=1 Tax=Hirsutella minnesotensis 3608 TaxID=1043627 RepID=A0A0F7ZLZ9_9HYPO|nr:hypothetical protein HIM_08994 [Hirsutella minnesotensis 3608]
MMSGNFKEAQNGTAVLEAVSVETFIRFAHFAYFGLDRYSSTFREDKLLDYARTYVFAHCYDVKNFRGHSEARIKARLGRSPDARIKARLERSPDAPYSANPKSKQFVEFAQYCFGEDALEWSRALIASFLAQRFTKVWEDGEIKAFINSSHELSTALLDQLCEQAKTSESRKHTAIDYV